MTEYPTSQEGPQPVASGGGTDEAGHGKAPIAATEAVRTHAAGTGAAAEPDGTAAAAASDARAARSAAGAGGSAGLPGPAATRPSPARCRPRPSPARARPAPGPVRAAWTRRSARPGTVVPTRPRARAAGVTTWPMTESAPRPARSRAVTAAPDATGAVRAAYRSQR